MKNPLHSFAKSSAIAAAALALILVGLDVQAVPAPAPAAVTKAPSNLPVAHPAAAPEEDILDIRGPIHIPATFPWAVWTAGALLVAGLGFGARKWARRPHSKWPYEIALEKLAATRPLMDGENAQPFALAVSEVVRLFIEECQPVRAAHRTTSEFLHDLVNLADSPLAAHREALAEFLQHCDLAKFARWSLTRPAMESMLTSASACIVAIGKPKTGKKQPRVSSPTAAPAAEPVVAHP